MTPEAPDYKLRPFNSPLECGLRMLFVLNADANRRSDLQRLISYDYLLVHSGDVPDGPESLHPSVPFRAAELLIKRDLISAGLNQMFSRELLVKSLSAEGILYCATELTNAFVSLFKTDYAFALHSRSKWVVSRFGIMNEGELSSFMSANIGRWGAEFDRLSAIKDLEL